MIFEVSKGWFGEKGWQRISFLRWLLMSGEFVTRVRKGGETDEQRNNG